jgi:hypothetical protein
MTARAKIIKPVSYRLKPEDMVKLVYKVIVKSQWPL